MTDHEISSEEFVEKTFKELANLLRKEESPVQRTLRIAQLSAAAIVDDLKGNENLTPKFKTVLENDEMVEAIIGFVSKGAIIVEGNSLGDCVNLVINIIAKFVVDKEDTLATLEELIESADRYIDMASAEEID